MKRVFTAIVVLACAAMAISCEGKKELITQGNPDKFDSLSYCMGANVGYSIKMQLGDVPFNIEEVKKGFAEGISKSSEQPHEEAVEILQEFFMHTLGERRQEIAIHNATADSLSVAPSIFKTTDECNSVSYALGNDIGTNMTSAKVALQIYWLQQGFQEGYDGKTQMSQEAIMSYLQHYFTVVLPAEAEKRSTEWLEKKEKSFGVNKTESGLLYKVEKEGDMSLAAKDDRDIVEVHYVGTLQDGTVFDASRYEDWPEARKKMVKEARPDLFDEEGKFTDDKPAKFPLNRVIKGWTEGMKLVGPGGVIRLYIPAELAYGKRGAGRDIGPNEALEFKVELLSVEPYVDEVPTVAPEVAPEVAPAEPAK